MTNFLDGNKEETARRRFIVRSSDNMTNALEVRQDSRIIPSLATSPRAMLAARSRQQPPPPPPPPPPH
jgi:hypothetical protein